MSLDLLRGIAILLVLGHHGPALPEGALAHSFTAVWKRCGWAGVDLFFALSGFLIMAQLLAEQEQTGVIDVKAFVARRLFKIYPPYVTFLVVVLAWEYCHREGASSVRVAAMAREFWPALAQLQNYLPVRPAPHLWSLAMEEHCYAMLLALGLLHAARRLERPSSRLVPVVVALLFAASWLGRWAYVAWGYPGSGPIGFTYTHNRLDAVLAGTIAAWLVRGRKGAPLARRHAACVIGIALVSFLPSLYLDPYEHRPLFLLGVLPLQALGFGCLLMALGARSVLAGAASREHGPGGRAWPVRLLAFVGVSSYSTYLWHLPFADAITREVTAKVPMSESVTLAAFLVSALGMGALGFWLIERPALAVRRRWQAAPARSGPIDAAGSLLVHEEAERPHLEAAIARAGVANRRHRD